MASTMISSMVHNKVACLMMMMMMMMTLISSATTKAEVSCDATVSAVKACVPYLSEGGAVTNECCSGIGGLYANANTAPDRQSVCKCLQNAFKALPSFKAGLLPTLPLKCGLMNLPYRFSTEINCNSVN